MCKSMLNQQLVKLQSQAVGKILTVAESGMDAGQFRAFKRLVMQVFHGELKPETIKAVNASDQAKGNLGKKGGAIMRE